MLRERKNMWREWNFKIVGGGVPNWRGQFGVKRFSKFHSRNEGQAVLAAVIFLVLLSTVIVGGFAGPVARETAINRSLAFSKQSVYAAESGVEDAVYRLMNELISVPASYDLSLNGITTPVDVAVVGNDYTITTEGNYQNRLRRVEVELDLSSIVPQFHYGVQAGEGGVKMSNNSRIEGAAGSVGNVYSNGPVEGASGATVTGTVTVGSSVVGTPDQSTECINDQIVGQTNPEIDFAQSFRASQSEPLAKVSLYLKKNGNPSNATVRILNDSGGSPGAMIGYGTLDANLVTTSYGWVDVIIENPPILSGNQNYWILLDASQHASKYWIWCEDTNNGYGNGVSKYKQDWNGGGGWTPSAGDLAFKTFVGTGESSIDDVIIYGDARASTIRTSQVCGDAYYEFIDAPSLSFLNDPSTPCPSPQTDGVGAIVSQSDPPAALPISQANIDEWAATAQAGGTCVEPVCDAGGNLTLDISEALSVGPLYVPGDLTLGNSAVLTITGTIHVGGNISPGNLSSIRCAGSYGSSSCVIMADGHINISNNTIFAGSGNEGSYLLMLTTITGCDGSSGTGCAPNYSGIYIKNNATGVIFYAPDSQILLENGIRVTEATGWKLYLSNNAIVMYEEGLLNANFTSGPGAGFNIIDWQEIE